MWSAMNKGIKISNGDIICMLNSDDYFTENALAIVAKYFRKYDLDYFFGAVKKKKGFHHFNPEFIDYKFNCYPSHSISFFVKKKYTKIIMMKVSNIVLIIVFFSNYLKVKNIDIKMEKNQN